MGINEEKVKLTVGVIGLGNGGSQVAEAAYFAGHDVIILNTSARDLSHDICEKIPRILIGPDGRGTGKNRDFSKAFLKDNLEGLANDPKFTMFIEGHDVIVVLAATGGGSGSGMGPFLCNRISAMWNSKTVIFYGILPKSTESNQVKFNTLNCINEVNLLKLPYMLADLSKYDDLDDHAAHEAIAKHVTKTLNIIRGDMMHESKHGMIDERDELTILSKPGFMAIYYLEGINESKLTKSLGKLLVDQFKSSGNVNTQNDKIVEYIGVMISAPEEFDDPLMKANFTDIIEVLGTPIDTFYNPHINGGATASVAMIASGMSLPVNRTQPLEEELRRYEESRKEKSASLDTNFKSFGKQTLNDEKISKLMGGNNKSKSSILDDIPDFL